MNKQLTRYLRAGFVIGWLTMILTLIMLASCSTGATRTSTNRQYLDVNTSVPNPAMRLLQSPTAPGLTVTADIGTWGGSFISTPSYSGTLPPSAWYTPTLPPPGVTITIPLPMRGRLPAPPTPDPRTPSPTFEPFEWVTSVPPSIPQTLEAAAAARQTSEAARKTGTPTFTPTP